MVTVLYLGSEEGPGGGSEGEGAGGAWRGGGGGRSEEGTGRARRGGGGAPLLVNSQ